MITDETHDDDVLEEGNAGLTHLSLAHQSTTVTLNIEYNGLLAHLFLIQRLSEVNSVGGYLVSLLLRFLLSNSLFLLSHTLLSVLNAVSHCLNLLHCSIDVFNGYLRIILRSMWVLDER